MLINKKNSEKIDQYDKFEENYSIIEENDKLIF
jgi:hypothetical protein